MPRRKRLLQDVKILAYADDVAVIANQEVIDILTEIFIVECGTAQQPVNIKKTKQLANKRNPKLEQRQTEKVEHFRYLGIRIKIRGKIAEQFRVIRQAVIQKSKRIAFVKRILPFRLMTKIWILYILPLIRYNSIAIWLQSKSQIKKWQTLKRNSFRMVMGLGKQYPEEIIDKIIGLLQVDINHEGYFKKQIEQELFRKYILLQEALIMKDTPLRRIQFENHQMLVYFYRFAKKLIDEDHDQVMESFCQLKGGYLWEQFVSRNPEFQVECEKINEFVDLIQKKVELVDQEEKRNEPIVRRTCYQMIRRIPGYHYFSLWKHQWKNSQTHGKFMTLEHIMEHLDSFHSDYSQRVKKQLITQITFQALLLKRLKKPQLIK